MCLCSHLLNRPRWGRRITSCTIGRQGTDNRLPCTGDAHSMMPLRPSAHTFLVLNERLALEAIWPQEFEWKEDAFVLTLTPAERVDEVFACVVLHVRFCEHSYPDTVRYRLTVPAITVRLICGGLTERHVAGGIQYCR